MKKFLIAGLAVAAAAVFTQPSLANPPQKPAPVAHPVAHPPAKAPAFHSPQMGGQHSAFGGQHSAFGGQHSAFGGQHPVNGFQGNRPGFAQQQHPGLRPVNRPGQFNAADHRAVDPRLGHNEQVRRDEQLHREQQVRREEVRHDEVRDEHRDERERHDALVREERRDARGRPGPGPQDQGGSADQSAPADSGAPADASSGNGVTDTLTKMQSVLDLFQGKGQGKGGDQGQ